MMLYLSLILAKHVEDILIDRVIAEQDLIALANQTDNKGRFLKDCPVLTAEEVYLVLD
jgi:hypothetical protein